MGRNDDGRGGRRTRGKRLERLGPQYASQQFIAGTIGVYSCEHPPSYAFGKRSGVLFSIFIEVPLGRVHLGPEGVVQGNGITIVAPPPHPLPQVLYGGGTPKEAAGPKVGNYFPGRVAITMGGVMTPQLHVLSGGELLPQLQSLPLSHSPPRPSPPSHSRISPYLLLKSG